MVILNCRFASSSNKSEKTITVNKDVDQRILHIIFHQIDSSTTSWRTRTSAEIKRLVNQERVYLQVICLSPPAFRSCNNDLSRKVRRLGYISQPVEAVSMDSYIHCHRHPFNSHKAHVSNNFHSTGRSKQTIHNAEIIEEKWA